MQDLTGDVGAVRGRQQHVAWRDFLSGSPARPSGTSDPNVAPLRGENDAGIRGVQIGPGDTVDADASVGERLRKERVNPTIAHFVAA